MPTELGNLGRLMHLTCVSPSAFYFHRLLPAHTEMREAAE